jgi:hypothetical protein
MRRATWLLTLILLSFAETLAGPARADVEDTEPSYQLGKAERRSDFTFGLLWGPAIGSSSGYLNELEKIGVPEFQAQTGAGFGFSSGLWLGGALRDWLTFGVGIRSTTFDGGGRRSEGAAFVLHIETYPLFAEGGIFRDLALVGEVGLGGRVIKEGSKTVAEGGSMSEFSLGAHWEAFRYWTHFAGGPALIVTHEFSESLRTTYGVLAFRTAFYGGP